MVDGNNYDYKKLKELSTVFRNWDQSKTFGDLLTGANFQPFHFPKNSSNLVYLSNKISREL